MTMTGEGADALDCIPGELLSTRSRLQCIPGRLQYIRAPHGQLPSRKCYRRGARSVVEADLGSLTPRRDPRSC